MKQIFMFLCVFILALSACSQTQEESNESTTEQNDNVDQDNQEASEENADENEEAESQDEEESNTATTKQNDDADQDSQGATNENSDNNDSEELEDEENAEEEAKQEVYENLSDSDIVAMAIQEESVNQISITADELLAGSFEPQGPGPSTVEEVRQLELTPMDYSIFPGMTEQQRVYEVSPNKANAQSIMIFDDASNEIIVTGTQHTPSYDEFRETGVVFNIDELFEKYYEENSNEEIAQKVNISDENVSEQTEQESSMAYEDYSQEDIIALAWLTYHYDETSVGSIPASPTTPYLEFSDNSNEPINPYNVENSESLPEGTTLISAEVLAEGIVNFRDNQDGTFTFYNLPSHFQDERWLKDDNYSINETTRIIEEAVTLPILDVPYSTVQSYSNIVRASEY